MSNVVNRKLAYQQHSHPDVAAAAEQLLLFAHRCHERSKGSHPVTQNEAEWTFQGVKSDTKVRTNHDNDSWNLEHNEARNSRPRRLCASKTTRLL